MTGRDLSLVLIMLISAVCLSGCLNQGTPPNNVDIKDESFQPATITVNAGTTVTWNNHDSTDETVTADDGSFDSGNISTGYEFRHTFLQPGTYTYHSKARPSMRGEVIVSSTSAYPSATSNASSAGASIGEQEAANVTGGVSGSGSTTISLIAKNIAFDKKTITVPAGASVTISFDNQDAGVPHNFAAYTDSSASSAIFVGQVISGPKKITYTFTAPSKPGTYFFRCDVHPTQMTGQLIVTPSAGASSSTTTASAQTAQNKTKAAANSNATSAGQSLPPIPARNNATANNAKSPATSPSVSSSPAPAASQARANAPSANATSAEVTAASGTTGTTISLAAKNIAFDKRTITVPAGARITLNFDNQDSGVPHNFAAYTDSSASNAIFVGQIINGPMKVTYTFTAPSNPGTYFFRCDVHPVQMTGQLIVTASGGSQGPASQASSTSKSPPQAGMTGSAAGSTNASSTNASSTNASSANASNASASAASSPNASSTSSITSSSSQASKKQITTIPGTSKPGTSNASSGLTLKDTVSIGNQSYNPSSLTVPAGTAVTWTNSDSSEHTVTSTEGKFDSGNMRPGSKFSYTFRDPGSYSYYCKIHTSMIGRIIAI